MLIEHDLRTWRVCLREAVSAGEPLNPEVIAQVRGAWGLTIRDAFGQTETTAQVGNPPGQLIKPGSMGRPLPGYTIVLIDGHGKPAEEGEICVDLAQRPVGLMQAYLDDAARTASAMGDGYYHTGAPDAATAASILQHVRERVSPYKRIRRLEFAVLPKTISGKIRRVELRQMEQARGAGETRRAGRSSGRRICASLASAPSATARRPLRAPR